MPHVTQAKRDAIKKNRRTSLTEEGDLNYVYTLFIIERWTETPRYKTIHDLKKIMYGGVTSSVLRQLDRDVQKRGWDVFDIQTAKQAAYDEFYLRVGRNYEMEKAHENGDVYAGVPFAVTIGQREEDQAPKRTRRSPLSGDGE